MSADPSLQPLRKTISSLRDIRRSLLPYLRILQADNHSKGTTTTTTPPTPHERAEAQCAVALAVGTLRYMGARLKGLDQGRKKGDPLRMELDRTRKTLKTLRALERGQAIDDRSGGESAAAVTAGGKSKSTSEGTGGEGVKSAPAANVNISNRSKQQSSTKREDSGGKILDKEASERMVRAALSSSSTQSSVREDFSRKRKDRQNDGSSRGQKDRREKGKKQKNVEGL